MRRLRPGNYSNCHGLSIQWHYLGEKPGIWLPGFFMNVTLVFEVMTKRFKIFRNLISF